MRVCLAYITVILLWSTTPLAIKWSGEGPGFLFGATARMVVGAGGILLALAGTRKRLPWHKRALTTYLAVALQIYGAMMTVYWGAQFIPSGWISVLFGLTPLMTALLAVYCLGERNLSLGKFLAYFFGIAGLAVMFGSALQLGRTAVMGITAVIIAALLQSLSAVWIKYINAGLPALVQVAGGLLFALPVYLLTWFVADGHWPVLLPPISVASILYLGIVATTFGFVLYYYLLTRLKATQVALITLVSPVLALLLGRTVNQEPLTFRVLGGSLLILSALVLHEYFDRFIGFKRVRSNGKSRH
jgi:drug/metabolite transporter (DMT)-like permease